MSASFWFIRPPVCMQVASIFLHPGTTSPAGSRPRATPIKKGSGPACPGLPQDSHKTPNCPVSTGVYGVQVWVSRGAAGAANSGRGQEKGGGKAAISGGGEVSLRLFSKEFLGS